MKTKIIIIIVILLSVISNQIVFAEDTSAILEKAENVNSFLQLLYLVTRPFLVI
jgi:hypothetical protein